MKPCRKIRKTSSAFTEDPGIRLSVAIGVVIDYKRVFGGALNLRSCGALADPAVAVAGVHRFTGSSVSQRTTGAAAFEVL